MFNVGFCVQHHTLSATLDMFDCVTGDTVRCGCFCRVVVGERALALKYATVLVMFRLRAKVSEYEFFCFPVP